MEGQDEDWKSSMELAWEKRLNKIMEIVRDYYENPEESEVEEEEIGEIKIDNEQLLNEDFQNNERDWQTKVDGDLVLDGNYIGLKQKMLESTGLIVERNKMEDCTEGFSSAYRGVMEFIQKEDMIINETFKGNFYRFLRQEKFKLFGFLQSEGGVEEEGVYYKNKWGKERIVFLSYDIACYDTKD